MRPTRIALTLLEAMMAMAIFATVIGVVLTAVQTGGQMQASISASDDAGNRNARALQTVIADLRYADINKIYIDGSAWTKTEGGSDYYSFKVCTGFSVNPGTEATSLNKLVTFGKGVVLKFSPNPDGTAGLYRTVYELDSLGLPVKTVEDNRLVVPELAWDYKAADGQVHKGFEISQLDPTQTAVVGNRLSVRAAAFTGPEQPNGFRPYRQLTSAVYLRGSMYDDLGLLPPVITSPEVATGNEGTAMIYDIVATNEPSRFAAASLPPGMICDPYTGRISGAPTSAGTFNAVISAYNDQGGDAQPLVFTIKGPLPVFTCPQAANGLVNENFLFTASASNGPCTFAATGLPTDATGALILHCTSTGIVYGMPTAPLNANVVLSATNANGTAYWPLRVTISAGALAPPEITSPLSAIATVNQAFTYTIVASNSPTSYAATNLPGGVSINTLSGAITGTPGTTGTWVSTISATNASGTGSAQLTITVQAPIPVITSSATATATVGDPFSYKITATNIAGVAAPFATSTRPEWMSFNAATGDLAGTPTLAGTVHLDLSATNSVGTGSKGLDITVNAQPVPVITVPAGLAATKGVLFSYTIVASHSPTSYGASNLPPGLTVSNAATGKISGTPTTTGTWTVGLTATNYGGTGNASTVITVSEPPTPPVIALGTKSVSGSTMQVKGTITVGSAGSFDKGTLVVTTNQDPKVEVSVYRGWEVASVKIGSNTTALQNNEFLVTVKSGVPAVIITATIKDPNGVMGSDSDSY